MAKQVFFLLLFAVQMASAGNGLNFRIHHEYQSLRALGMGDAFVAVANDYSGLFYNPAALARREDGQLNMFIDIGASTDIGTFVSEVGEASKNVSSPQVAVAEVLESAYGKSFGGRFIAPSAVLVRPGWGLAVLPMDVSLNLDVHRQGLGPGLNMSMIADTTIAYGWAKDFYLVEGTRTSAGFTVKAVNRGYLNEFVTAIDLATGEQLITAGMLSEGFTVDADVGALVTPDLPNEGLWSYLRLARPTFGAVVRNVLDYGFTKETNIFNKDKNSEAPEKLHRRLDLGSRWEYPEFFIFGGRGAMDIRDILHPEFTLKKGLHLGFEFDWTMFSWWRGQYRVGLNQGYYTLGASALFSIFNLDLVTYAEDVGTPNNPRENRKFELRMNIDI